MKILPRVYQPTVISCVRYDYDWLGKRNLFRFEVVTWINNLHFIRLLAIHTNTVECIDAHQDTVRFAFRCEQTDKIYIIKFRYLQKQSNKVLFDAFCLHATNARILFCADTFFSLSLFGISTFLSSFEFLPSENVVRFVLFCVLVVFTLLFRKLINWFRIVSRFDARWK